MHVHGDSAAKYRDFVKTKNPYEAESQEELLEIAFYWLQKSYMLQVERTALLEILIDNKIPATAADLLEKMNKVMQKECPES